MFIPYEYIDAKEIANDYPEDLERITEPSNNENIDKLEQLLVPQRKESSLSNPSYLESPDP